MNTHRTDTLLKRLDVASPEPLNPVAQRRAQARMEQIIATDRTAASAQAGRPRRSAWPRPAVAFTSLAAVAAFAIAAGVTLTPSGDAYASWTAVAEPVTEAETALAAGACVAHRENVILAERRGEWVAIAAEDPSPGFAMCLVHLPVGAAAAGETHRGVGGGRGAVPAAGEFTDGAISETRDPGFLGLGGSPVVAFNIGYVGPDVTAVTITTADGDRVEATVENGRFLAWWPGTAFGDRTEGNGGPAPDLTYTLTLDSGRVINNAVPVLPR